MNFVHGRRGLFVGPNSISLLHIRSKEMKISDKLKVVLLGIASLVVVVILTIITAKYGNFENVDFSNFHPW